MTLPVVFLVDDNSMTRQFVRGVLRSEPLTIVEACSAKEALALAPGSRAELVLLDIVLPDGSGFDLVDPLRAMLGSSVPIVAVTGLVSRGEEGRLGSAGFDDIVVKPIEASRLLAAVKAYLPERSAGGDTFGRGKRIVIADDDPVQRKLSVYSLSRLGFEVHAAPDGRRALELARLVRPHIVVSDVLMPGVDGFELCADLRSDPALSDVPVVLLTNSYVEDADRALAEKVGADGYVIRTHDFHELIELLRTVVVSGRRKASTMHEPTAARGERLVRTAHQLDRQLALNVALAQRSAVLAAQISILGGLTSALVEDGEVESALDQALHACLDAGGISWGLLIVRQRDVWVRRTLGVTDVEQRAIETSTETILEWLRAGGPRAPTRRQGALIGLDRVDEVLVVPVARRDELLGAIILRDSQALDEQRMAFIQVVAGQLALVLALARSFLRLEDTSKEERARAQLLASMLDAIGTPLVVVDAHGRPIRWNAAGETFLFLTDDTAGEIVDLYTADQARRLSHDESPITCAIRGVPVDDVEICVRVDSAEPRWLRITARAVEGDDGASGAVAVIRDVTDERRSQARQIVNDRLASVGLLAAGVAHEINNPLTSVLAEIEMAIPYLTGQDRAVEHLNTALDAAHRVRTIVSDMRTLSRDGANDALVAVDLSRAVDTALRMAVPHTRGRATVITDLAEAPPVLANESRLVQVFLNLVVNAAQALPDTLSPDRRTIRVRVGAGREGGARVDVTDAGVGMSPDVRARIFTPFFTTKPLGTGTGLGLSICQRIVTQFGGTIDCDSAPGRGTTFSVSLPAAPAGTALPRMSAPSVRSGNIGLRVMVVDGDPFVRHSVTRALRAEHDVIAIANANEACSRIEAGEPVDLVLYEAQAEGLEAPAFWERMSSGALATQPRIAFLFGRTTRSSLRDFVSSVAAPELEKPIDSRALVRFVAEHVERRS